MFLDRKIAKFITVGAEKIRCVPKIWTWPIFQ